MKLKSLLCCLMVSVSLYSYAEPIEVPQYDDLSKARLSSIECLSANLYHESRSESNLANIKIISVVLNRVNSGNYPNDICEVVFQRKQFSWTSDKLSDKILDKKQYIRLYRLSEQAIINKDFILSISDGVNHYHTVTSSPYWSTSGRMVYKGTVDNHRFYKQSGF